MDIDTTSGVVQVCPSGAPMLMRTSFMLREYTCTVHVLHASQVSGMYTCTYLPVFHPVYVYTYNDGKSFAFKYIHGSILYTGMYACTCTCIHTYIL